MRVNFSEALLNMLNIVTYMTTVDTSGNMPERVAGFAWTTVVTEV
jgi:hypothetical protein